ncbi:MAG TPA: DUF3368 domain-containing protein [Phycisphaerae bacterium]|nr:DUF3368 domain-containing protein [Phycisphaerae bacterium]
MIVIADTSPIHYLVLIRQSDVLSALFSRIVLPQAVAAELQQVKTPPTVRTWMVSPPEWLEVRTPRAVQAMGDLGAGEAEAISLALEMRADLVLADDAEAREMATTLGAARHGNHRSPGAGGIAESG